MAIQFDQLLDGSRQSALADEIVTAAVAVVSGASAPEFAMQTVEKGISSGLSEEQRSAAAVLQAYAAACAAEVLTPALDASAVERAGAFKAMLDKKCPHDELAALEKSPQAAHFKSAVCHSIVGKCADLAAAEIDRLKKGKITILNEEDQEMFNRQHREHQEKQTRATISFLSSLPQRHPDFGRPLFDNIRKHVQRDIEERYKSPDIHARVDSLFNDALAEMPADGQSSSSRTA